MEKIPLSTTLISFFELDVADGYMDDEEVPAEVRFVLALVDFKNRKLSIPKKRGEVEDLRRIISDLSNEADEVSREPGAPEHHRAFMRKASDQLTTIVSKLSGRELTENARRGEKKSEARQRFLDDVEALDPSLLSLARRIENRIPMQPKGGKASRLEFFLQYAEENPDAAIAALEADSEAIQRGYMRELKAQEAEYEYEDPYYDTLGEPEPSHEYGERHPHFEEFLSDKELRMLERVIDRELAKGDGHIHRRLQAFYRKNG